MGALKRRHFNHESGVRLQESPVMSTTTSLPNAVSL